METIIDKLQRYTEMNPGAPILFDEAHTKGVTYAQLDDMSGRVYAWLKANKIGKELASRMTDDQFAYVVATHIDKHHIHNHIIICSTDLEGQHKYRDVKQSAKDLAQISDSLCREHSLSVIQNPQDKTVTYDK